ncbi:unnamed protein product [Rhizoctonia solani]|uniref:Uncharacterized protein n=1 Tax=Rhizoctonia solani TaxID=456999 RepID=A0A8H3GJY4_9AGAM|nr:unnamed protein product [Rhizoctonia solani]
MDVHEIYFTAGVSLHSQCSVFAPVRSNKRIGKTINNGLNSHRSPPPVDDSETDGSSQEEEPVLTPPMEGDVLLGPEEKQPRPHSISPNNFGIPKSDEETKQSRGLQSICSRTHGSGQYFRLAHEYAESARAAAQVELNRIISEYHSNDYSRMHSLYDHWTATVLDGPQYHMYPQVHDDPSGILEGEMGYELGWTSGAWNVYSYGETGEAGWFHPTE